MATITERFDSGEGDAVGIDVLQASRRFDVYLLSVSGDDVNDPVTPLAVEYPVGSVHNIYRHLQAARYRKVERVENTVGQWIMEIEYEVAITGQTVALADWDIEFDNGLELVPMPLDLSDPPQDVGGGAYRFTKEGEQRSGYAVETIDGLKYLESIPKAFTPLALDRLVPTFTIMARRTVPVLTAPQYKAAKSYLGWVNHDVFLDVADTKTALFAGLRARRRPGHLEGREQLEPGVVFDLDVLFLGNINGWTPEEVYDLFEFGGYKSRVTDPNGDPVVRSFTKYGVENLFNIFTILGGAPVQRAGPVEVVP